MLSHKIHLQVLGAFVVDSFYKDDKLCVVETEKSNIWI